MVCDARMSWPQAMRSAPNDSVRLLLLDMASSVRRGLRSFVDDTRVPVASLGHATAAIQVLSEAASTDQYVYKAGKNCILAHAFPKMKPLMLQGSSVEFVDSTFSSESHWVLSSMEERTSSASLLVALRKCTS